MQEQNMNPDHDSDPEQTSNICGRIVYSKPVQNFILICIVLNSIQLGLDTAAWWRNLVGDFSDTLDDIFLWIFAVEIILKLISDKAAFFKKGWNNFDFIIVAISFVPGQGIFSVLRVFRIFRAVRLLYRIRRLRVITESLFSSIPSIGWICVLLSICFYVCSVIATNLFGDAFPEWFGDIGKSMYSLFQIMTLESWSMGIVRPVMEQFPYAWIMFVPFIIFATYTIMNLFIGIMVNAISDAQSARTQEQTDKKEESGKQEDPASMTELLNEIKSLHSEIHSLQEENRSIKNMLSEKNR